MKEFRVVMQNKDVYLVKAHLFRVDRQFLIFEDFDEDCEPYEVAIFTEWSAAIEVEALTLGVVHNEKMAD